MNKTYAQIIIAQGLDLNDYADCDEWELSMLFDSVDDDEDEYAENPYN